LYLASAASAKPRIPLQPVAQGTAKLAQPVKLNQPERRPLATAVSRWKNWVVNIEDKNSAIILAP